MCEQSVISLMSFKSGNHHHIIGLFRFMPETKTTVGMVPISEVWKGCLRLGSRSWKVCKIWFLAKVAFDFIGLS